MSHPSNAGNCVSTPFPWPSPNGSISSNVSGKDVVVDSEGAVSMHMSYHVVTTLLKRERLYCVS